MFVIFFSLFGFVCLVNDKRMEVSWAFLGGVVLNSKQPGVVGKQALGMRAPSVAEY